MSCITPDGIPTSSCLALLKSLDKTVLSSQEIAAKTGQPLFRVRSDLFELVSAGFVEEDSEKYSLTLNGEMLTRYYREKAYFFDNIKF